MTIISPRKSVKLSYQQLLKAVRALPPRQQQQLREVLMPTEGVYLVRPSRSASAVRRGQRMAKAIQSQLAKATTGTLEETMKQLRGRSWSL